jgi:hypothetical protein
MGIRFQCPNGHPLNVKSELAGKRAACPNCGAKLVIPTRSADTSPSDETAPIDRSVELKLQTDVESEAATAATSPSAADLVAATSNSAPPAPPAANSSAPVWYVRPASGGQFGPASEELFRDWIGEGRVAADAYVWRDGWPDWKVVRDVTDSLPAPLPAIPAVAGLVAPPPGSPPVVGEVSATAPPIPAATSSATEPAAAGQAPAAVENQTPASRYAARRRRTKQARFKMAVLMLIAALILAAILIWVVRRGATPSAGKDFPRAIQLAGLNRSAYVADVAALAGGTLIQDSPTASSAL